MIRGVRTCPHHPALRHQADNLTERRSPADEGDSNSPFDPPGSRLVRFIEPALDLVRLGGIQRIENRYGFVPVLSCGLGFALLFEYDPEGSKTLRFSEAIANLVEDREALAKAVSGFRVALLVHVKAPFSIAIAEPPSSLKAEFACHLPSCQYFLRLKKLNRQSARRQENSSICLSYASRITDTMFGRSSSSHSSASESLENLEAIFGS
jgi:hypothetical protein